MTTNTDFTNLTVVEFLTMVKEVCEEFPGNRNPERTDGKPGCAYKANTTHGECNCLIGHVLIYKMGLPWQFEWEGNAASLVLSYVGILPDYYHESSRWSAIADMADKVQGLADDQDPDGVERDTWGEVWECFEVTHPHWASGDVTSIYEEES